MDIVTIDFETYYDREYSLSKMTTEAYVRDPRFEVIGVALKVNDQEVDWYSGKDPGGFLNAIDYSDKAILCHNTAFDGAILSWHFGVKPKFWFDTLSMARPLHALTVGGSLKALATYYKLGDKGDEVLRTLGMRRRDFTPEQMEAYADYCIQDVNLTYQLFKKMAKGFPREELLVIDQTLRMYTEPKFILDPVVLDAHLASIHERKAKLLAKLGGEEKAKKFLMSNKKFADLLKAFGVAPPMKTSPTTGKQTFAFAKNDVEFTALLEHPNPAVRTVVEARLGTKSTIEETRTNRFLEISERGPLPIMLNYYGAHTGRFSGGDKVNLQNLPRGGALRKALAAPDGHVVVACDSSQIEARLVAYLAGQDDLVQSFREGRDVYSAFATDVYQRPVTKADKVERHVGKTCVAEGTLVLSDSGWKPIETITTGDRVWDGEEWVCHAGLAYNGMKQTLPLCGVWLTPDHLVWSGTQWKEAGWLVHDGFTLSQALAIAAENLPLQGTFAVNGAGSAPSLSGAIAVQMNTPWTPTTSKRFGQLVVQYAQRLRQAVNGIGRTLRNYLMMTTALVCSTGCRPPLAGATTLQTVPTSITAGVASSYTRHGGTIEVCSCVTCRHSKGGTILRGNSTAWTTMPGTNRGTYGSQLVPRTRQTRGGSLSLKPVYDILNSGSRNRFTILTNAGPIIVHNCILGLGFGMGPPKFQHSLATGFISVKVEDHEAQKIVNLYRNKYHRIQALWNRCGHELGKMVAGAKGDLCDLVSYDAEGIILPNGLRIRYPALRRTDSGFQYINDPRTYRKFIKARVMGDEEPELSWTKLYGGKCLAGDTEVLTDKGWVYLRDVTRAHRVWDGTRWVKHDGLIYQGKKVTTVVNGVRMTPDHNVLTEAGWRCASSSEGLHRAGFWLPDGSKVSGDKWPTLNMGLPVQLRDGSFSGGYQRGKVCPAWWAPVVRVQGWSREQITRLVAAPSVLGMAIHAGPMPSTYTPSMAQLRGTRYQGVPGVGAVVRGVLGRHGADVSGRSDAGPEGQQRRLHPGELPVGDISGAGREQAQLAPSGHNQGTQGDWRFQIDTSVSVEPEPVYDILNAGPDTRFVVRGPSGPFIVHNCVENITQAVARIVVSEQMVKIGRRYPVALQVHDEIVCVVPEEQAEECKRFMIEVMSTPPKWAPDLPVACEADVGPNYGSAK